MARESWETMINAFTFSGTETGTELKESATRTAISPGALTTGKVLTIPANFFVVGHTMRIKAGGVMGTAEAENSINLAPIWCTGTQTAAEGKFFFPEAQTLVKVAASGKRKKFGWSYELISRCTVAGEKGKFISSGMFMVQNKETKLGEMFVFPTAESAALGESEELNLLLEGKLAFGWKFTTSAAEDLVQQTIWTVEVLN